MKNTRHDLFSGWRALSQQGGESDPALLLEQVTDALDMGEPLLALDICRHSLARKAMSPTAHVRFRQLEALALSRSGAPSAAQRAITALLDEQSKDDPTAMSESLGILAGTFKELWQRETGATKPQLLSRAIDAYERMHACIPRPWSGINLAVLRLASGERETAYALARQVAADLDGQSQEDETWSALTRAECALLLGERPSARDFYAKARSRRGSEGRFASARRNARIIAAAQAMTDSELEAMFPRRELVLFVGHRIGSDHESQRFPAHREASVAQAIQRMLAARDARIGMSSASCGGDILFLEAMIERHADVHVMLPQPPEQFRATSVAPGWHERFDRVLRGAATVTVVARDAADPIDSEFGNHMLLGLALLKARQYGAKLTGLALWDGKEGPSGGVATTVELWSRRSIPLAIISPTEEGERSGSDIKPRGEAGSEREAKAILFADAVGFSNLTSEHAARFADGVLGPLGQTLDSLGDIVLCRNTWGDALYIVFGRLSVAARFAEQVTRACSPEAMRALALPESLAFRVALHAGPVREVYDPVSKARNFIGPHVNWGARIEPIAPPGSVYASEPFAALCTLEGDASMPEFAFVGSVPLAKGFGVQPLYVMQRGS